VFVLKPCVHDEQHRDCLNRSESDPAFLALGEGIALSQSVRILESQGRGFEADSVFGQIAAVFLFVPFDAPGRYLRLC